MGSQPMQRRPKTTAAMATAEEGSACLVRRLPWASILRAALLLFVIGTGINSILSSQRLSRQRALESPGVSRDGTATESHVRHLLGSLGTSGGTRPGGGAGGRWATRKRVGGRGTRRRRQAKEQANKQKTKSE